MFPTQLGNGFWIVHNSTQILDAAFTQYCTASPLKSSRDIDYLRTQFNRYLILAYRTPQIYPQLVHLSFRDNMRLIIEGTCLPNTYLNLCAHQGVRPKVSDINISIDLIACAVIYRVNPNQESESFVQWGFLEVCHRNVAIASLTSLGVCPDLLAVAKNTELDELLFIHGHAGCIVGTTCISGELSTIQKVSIDLDPTLRDTFSEFPSFVKRFKSAVSKAQQNSEEFIVEREHGHVYRTRVTQRTREISWQPEPNTVEVRNLFNGYDVDTRYGCGVSSNGNAHCE